MSLVQTASNAVVWKAKANVVKAYKSRMMMECHILALIKMFRSSPKSSPWNSLFARYDENKWFCMKCAVIK